MEDTEPWEKYNDAAFYKDYSSSFMDRRLKCLLQQLRSQVWGSDLGTSGEKEQM